MIKQIKKFLNRLVNTIYGSETIDFQTKTIFKYMPGRDYNIESIEKNYFFFSRLSQVNDPEDCTINPLPDLWGTTKEEIEKKILANAKPQEVDNLKKYAAKLANDKSTQKEYLEQLKPILQADDDDYKKGFKMLCLTENYQSIHMWQNYSRNKKPMDGFCIGYECEIGNPETFVHMHRKNKLKIKLGSVIDSGKNQSSLCAYEVFYGEDTSIAYNPFKNNKEALLHSYFYKKSKWSPEEEFRILLTDDQTTNPTLQSIQYEEDKLKIVIFGKNCGSKTRKKILEAIYQNGNYKNLKFYEASLICGKIRFKELKHYA